MHHNSDISIRFPGEDDKQSGSDKSKHTAEDTADENKEEENININRSWYNMVCYGAPNLMVTQLSKP